MNTKFTIKNFRVFDENGVTLELKPLTILTGCNSSGKSSVVKALLLLCDYFSSLKIEEENGKKIDLSSHELDFTKKPHNLLGKFSKVVNNRSEGKSITFEIRVHSLMLTQDVNLELIFSVDEDYFNGFLSSISIKKLDDTVIYSSKIDSNPIGNLYCLLPEFERFIKTQHVISSYQFVCNDRNIGFSDNPMSEEDFAVFQEEVKTYIESFKQENGTETLKDINKWNNSLRFSSKGIFNKSFLDECSSEKPELIQGIQDTGILYYLPIFDEKLRGNKNICIDFLTHCLSMGTMDRATSSVLEKILVDFKNSPCQDFLTYYKLWEENRLSEFVMKPSWRTEKSPRLFVANHIGLHADEILMAPHNTNWSDSINIFSGEVTPQKPKKEQEAEWEDKPLNFERMYEALARLSQIFIPEEKPLYYNKPNGKEYMEYSSRTEYLFFKFVETAIQEIVVDATPEALAYVSSSIINVKRLYPMESEDEFTGLLKRYMKAKHNIAKDANYTPDSFLNKWIGKDGFDIANRISIDVDNEGLGITLRLHKDENDLEGSLLADSGYGITQLFATLLNIEVAILERKAINVLPDNFTGSLPSEKDVLKSFSSPTVAIEEPEIHLHPSYQSKLADMFVDAYENYNIHFIIETHSEYLIRKLQVMVADKEIALESNHLSLNYVGKDESGVSANRKIEIQEDGALSEPFGSGFYDEADTLSMDLFRRKTILS